MGKVLTAYFNLSGTTEKMAEYIASSYIPILMVRAPGGKNIRHS